MNKETTTLISSLALICGFIRSAQSGSYSGNLVSLISGSIGYTLGILFIPLGVSAAVALFRPKGSKMKAFHISYCILGIVFLLLIAFVIFNHTSR